MPISSSKLLPVKSSQVKLKFNQSHASPLYIWKSESEPKKGHWSKKNDLSFISVYLQPFLQSFLLCDAYRCYFLDPVTNVFVSGVPRAVTFSQFINQKHNHKILAYFPHKKIKQCLTDINQCLTNIGQF